MKQKQVITSVQVKWLEPPEFIPISLATTSFATSPKWHASLSQAKPLMFRESIVLLKNKTLWAHALGHANPYNRNGCTSASI